MTTAVPERGSDVAVFRQQAGMIHKVVRLNLKELTQEDSLVQPAGGGNCLNWIVGHLVCIYDESLPLVGQEPVGKGAFKRYARGTPPLTDPAEAMDLQELLTAWDEVTERFVAGLASLTTEGLDRPAPRSPSGNPDETFRSLLSTVLFHQSYHAGQTGILRRVAGKEGAIR